MLALSSWCRSRRARSSCSPGSMSCRGSLLGVGSGSRVPGRYPPRLSHRIKRRRLLRSTVIQASRQLWGQSSRSWRWAVRWSRKALAVWMSPRHRSAVAAEIWPRRQRAGSDEHGAQVGHRKRLRPGIERVVGQAELALGDLGHQVQAGEVVPVAQQRSRSAGGGEGIAHGLEFGSDHAVRSGQRGLDLRGGLAGEASWPTAVRGAAAECLLAANGAIDDWCLIAGRADIRAGGGGLQRDAFEPAADATGPSRVAVTAGAEVPRRLALAAGTGGECSDGSALIAGIVVGGAEAGIAGHADGPAVRSAGIDAALSSASGAPLLRCAAGAAGSALAPVQGMIPAQVLVPSAVKTGAADDRVRHPVSRRRV